MPNSGFSFITEQFLLLLSNKDIGKLDISLSDEDMRRAFYSRLGSYYSFNDIKYKGELEFLAKRNIALTRCVIDFRCSAYTRVPIEGNKYYNIIHRLQLSDKYIHAGVEINPILSQLIAQSPCLSEIAIARSKDICIDIDETTLLALGTHRRPHMKKVDLNTYPLFSDTISSFCLACPNLIAFKVRIRGRGTVTVHNACAQAVITYCPNLEVLELESWEISDSFLPSILTLTSLRELSLIQSDKLTSTGIQSLLRSLKDIEKLSLAGHQLDADSVSVLQCIGSSCPKLKFLYIWTTACENIPPVPTISLLYPLLERVDLNMDTSLADPIMLALALLCPALRTLHLHNGGTDVGMRAVLQGCPLLENLGLLEMDTYASSDVPLVEAACPCLSKLRLRSPSVSDYQLCSLFRHTPNLAMLSLLLGPLATDTTIACLSQHCRWLTAFTLKLTSFGRCTIRITLASLFALTSLESLNVSVLSMPAVTSTDLAALAAGCPRLRDVCLTKCAYDVTVEDILMFIDKFTYLQSFAVLGGDGSCRDDVVVNRDNILKQRVKDMYPLLRFEFNKFT